MNKLNNIDYYNVNIGSVIKQISLFLCLFGVGVLCTLLSWYILLICLLLFIIFAIIFIKFEYGIYLLLFMLPISIGVMGFELKYNFIIIRDNNSVDSIPIYFPFVILSFVGFILNRFAKIRNILSPNPLLFPIFILFGFAFVTILWSPNIGHSMVYFLILVINLMVFVLFSYAIVDEKIHKRVMWCWTISGAIQGLIAISLYFVNTRSYDYILINSVHEVLENVNFRLIIIAGPKTLGNLLRRARGFAFPQELALFMNMFFPVALGLFLTTKNRFRKLVLLFIMVILISTQLLAMSRGGLGSLVIMVLFLFIALKTLRKHFFILFTSFLLALILIFQSQNLVLNKLFFQKEVTPRLVYKVTKGGANTETQMSERYKMWKAGFHKLKETSFAGLGIGNFLFYTKFSPHAHSIYFSLLFDFGLVGLVVGFSILIIFGIRSLPMLNYQSSYFQIMNISLIGGCIALGVHGLVDFAYYNQIIWLYLGIAIATLNLTNTELLKKSQ